MKNILYLLMLCPAFVVAQSQSQNYIKTTKYRIPVAESAIATVADTDKTVNVTYYDALGRTIQQVASKQSATGNDMVNAIEYDIFGRQVKKYLPYIRTASLDFDPNAIQATFSFYATNNQLLTRSPDFPVTGTPFSAIQYEPSPLSRVLKNASPGTDWAMASGHALKKEYQANGANEVRFFRAASIWDSSLGIYTTSLSQNGSTNYAAGQLYKTIDYDENSAATPLEANGSTVVFTNKDGETILRRVYNAGVKYDTYYVYDQFRNLSYMVPPASSGNLTADVLDNLCFQYRYDSYDRQVEKKVPGRQWEYTVYDRRDRVVASGPAFTPFGGTAEGWLLSRYDNSDRECITGWTPATGFTSLARKALQDASNTALINVIPGNSTLDGIAIGYATVTVPTGFRLLMANYYDNYSFLASGTLPAVSTQLDYINTGGAVTPKGLQTGSWVRDLTGSTASDGEMAYILFDKKSRPIRNYKRNRFGGYTYRDVVLSFTGQILTSTTHHKLLPTNTELFITENLSYDSQDRLIKHVHKINSGTPELLAFNKYSELGVLDYKRVGGTDISGGTGIQKIDYTYNIRGWLTGINNTDNLLVSGDPDDLFAFRINYNTVQNLTNYTGTPLYNGNISETYWKSAADNVLRKYGYKYDGLNRLTQAIYQKPNLAIPVTNSYNESLSYDNNGNILSLSRNGYYDNLASDVYTIDNLQYTYSPQTNRLLKIDDSSNSLDGFRDRNTVSYDYSYDTYGNLIEDNNKQIKEIIYNHLNLPTLVSWGSTKYIRFTYNALGEKLSKVVLENGVTKTTLYEDNFQYLNNHLQFFSTEEGYVSVVKDELFTYIYNYQDHLGNIRMSFLKDADKPNPKVIEENNYYPFGLKHENYNSEKFELTTRDDGVSIVLAPTTRNIYQYKYNGKEFQDEVGLNLYDYGARNYDPTLGRWMNIDMLSEVSEDESPFHYAHNNPVIYIDPTGLTGQSWTTKYLDTKGNTLLDTDDGSDDVIIVPDKELKDFKELVKYTPKEMSDGYEWNEQFKAKFLGLTPDNMDSLLNGFSTQWSRQFAINYIQNPTFANAMKMAYSEALSQWTSPQKVLAAATVLAGVPIEGAAAENGGIIYLRTDRTGGLKPYVGQVKSEARYLIRQTEHARDYKNADFEFKIINRGSANGQFPTSLDVKEQQALDNLNGPVNKSHPNGGTSNKKNIIKKK